MKSDDGLKPNIYKSCRNYQHTFVMPLQITAATITTGEKVDGKELKALVEKSIEAGHLAIGRRMNARTKIQGTQLRYMFDVEKCKKCSMKKGCYKEGAKTKAYTVAIKESIHNEQQNFQQSEYFKEKARERYKIEAKNSELKVFQWPR